jgi:hypothetical protein
MAMSAATVLDRLAAGETDRLHHHHNFAGREEVPGAPARVLRKGCTPIFPGQRGFVGGSMGDAAVIRRAAPARTDGPRRGLATFPDIPPFFQTSIEDCRHRFRAA